MKRVNTKTQCATILRELRKNRSVGSQFATENNIRCLSKRISELREEGNLIIRTDTEFGDPSYRLQRPTSAFVRLALATSNGRTRTLFSSKKLGQV